MRGPRQVGKSVLLRQLASSLLKQGWPPSHVTRIDFSDDRVRDLGIGPRDVVEAIAPDRDPSHGPRHVFLFDEIAKVDRWDLWLKQAVDSSSHRFVVTDSSAHLLRSGTRESGQGRWDDYVLEPLTYVEFARLSYGTGADPQSVRDRALSRYMALGGFPEHVAAEDHRRVWERLRSDLAEKAVLSELVRAQVDAESARRLFVYLVRRSGAILNVAEVAKDLGRDQRAIGGWLSLLEDLALLQRLEPSGTPRKTMRTHPRIYASDHGMVAAFADAADPMADDQVTGSLHETLVFRHLREVVGRNEIRYFRKDNRHEIDFVISTPAGDVGVEVTAKREPAGDKVMAARVAAEKAGLKSMVLVHGGLTREIRTDVLLLPLHEFLQKPEIVTEGV